MVKDPDDLIRSAKGPQAVQEVLDQALPMVKLLWQRETEGKVFDSPERKAALDKALREKIRLIRDPSIRRHYGEDIQGSCAGHCFAATVPARRCAAPLRFWHQILPPMPEAGYDQGYDSGYHPDQGYDMGYDQAPAF